MSDTIINARHTTATSEPALGKSTTIAVALGIASLIVLLIRNTNDGPIWRVTLIVGAAIAIVTWVVFGIVTRRTLAKQSPKSSTRAALVLGVMAVLSNVAFWMAVPPIFGVAAVALAMDARDRRPFRREWLAAVAGLCGALGTVASLVLSCLG